MESLETELERARALDVDELADAVESIGFECTRCGGCCTGEAEEPHTATVFPDEVRELQERGGYDWRDVARPMPYGLEGDDATGDGTSSGDAADDGTASDDATGDAAGDSEAGDAADQTGTTFEWALQTDACGDCAFYEERDGADESDPGDTDESDSEDTDEADSGDTDEPGPGYCTVHEDRPLICQTYPFSVALGGTTQPMGEAVDEAGMVRAHECEGLGRDIDRSDALALAETLKERAVRELEEALDVRERYEHVEPAAGQVVVHDSEGAKERDGQPIDPDRSGSPDGSREE